VAVYEMSEDELDLVDAQNQKLLETWQNCLKTGVFPGYCTTEHHMMLPEWALSDNPTTTPTIDGEAMF
jgi:hypothetical protein